jgi:pimeloyl-ACP methyl ester carboxylesterase
MFAPQLASEQLAEKATLVAIDRPGWGQSIIIDDDGELSLARQSALLGPLLARLKERYLSDNLVLVGHSLGGSLVPRIAVDHPEVVDAVVAVAGDLTDDYSPANWFNHVASWKFASWLLPTKADKANREVMALAADLATMKSRWPELAVPLLVLQGQDDGLVDPRHAQFAETLTTASRVTVKKFEGAGHLLHLTHSKQVNQLLAEVVERHHSGIFGDQ